MTPEEIGLVRSGYAALAPRAEALARSFYQHLFALAPSLRPLFRRHLDEQGRLLMQALDLAIGMLDQPHKLLPLLRDLGRRHAGYGVTREQYDVVGQALLDSLDAALGAAFTAAQRQAWTALYGAVAATMQDGAAPERDLPFLAAS